MTVERLIWNRRCPSSGWKPPILLLVILFFFLFSIQNSSAQTTTSGGLTGVVSDPSRAAVPNANVEIEDNTKGTREATKTDSDGVYRFFFVPPGEYALTVSHPGFREENEKINVLLGLARTRNVTLKLAGTSATVQVTDEVQLLQAENGDVSTTMGQKQVSEIPNPGNDLTYIAQTAPGAIMNTDGIGYGGSGNFSILGMPGTSNLFTLNGLSDNNIGLSINNNVEANSNNSGATGLLLGQNEVQEATVVSNGYSGQFGGAAGSSINYLTKSGSNTFHGNAQYYWNGTVMNANDWIDNALGPLGNPRPKSIAHQWTGSLGGPIKKDKLFFFIDSEGVRVILPYSFQPVVPSPAFETATLANIDKIFGSNSASDKFYRQIFNLYNSSPGESTALPGTFSDSIGCNGWTDPTDPNNPNRLGTKNYPCSVHFSRNASVPSDDSIVSGRADWNVASGDRLFLFVQNGNGQIPLHVDPLLPIFNSYCKQSTWQGHLSETHAIGPTSSNQFLLGGSFIDGTCSVANSAQALAAFPTELSWFQTGVPFNDVGGFDLHYAKPFGARTTEYQISDDFVKTRGQHRFSLGISFLRTDLTHGGYNRYGVGLYVPLSLNAFFYGGVDPINPVTKSTTLTQSYPLSASNRFAFYSLGLYGQEEWHARSNLTLTVALRADHQSNPVCQNRCFSRLSGPLSSLSHDPNQPYNSGILTNLKQAYANTDAILWSPRFSFAWQPFGVSHNTVLRGGVGFFYDPIPGGPAINLGSNSPSYDLYQISGYNLAPDEMNSLFKKTTTFDMNFSQSFKNGQSFADIKAADPQFIPPSFQNPAARMHSAQYQKWSLQAQQSFGASTSLTIGYFGNHGIHELVQNPNANAFGFGSYPAALCTTPLVQPCADPRFGGVTELQTNAISNYNGLVVSVAQLFNNWGGGSAQVNYTYGHALDEVSNGGLSPFTTQNSIYPQDANNLRGSYGAADYDSRHSLTGNFVWRVPFHEVFRGHGPDSLVKGWQVSGTVLAYTGLPYTVIDNAYALTLFNKNFFGPIFSVPVAPLGPSGPCGKGAAIPAAPVPCLPPEVQSDGSTPNPGALFVQTGCETGFNTGKLPGPKGPCSGPSVTYAQGRDRFRGPAFFNFDFSVVKNTKVPRWENATLGIGAQFFNFFNHANFGFPDPSSSDQSLGQIFYIRQPATTLLGSTNQANAGRRMIQLKVQLQF